MQIASKHLKHLHHLDEQRLGIYTNNISHASELPLKINFPLA